MAEQTNILEAVKTIVHEEVWPFRDEVKKDIANFKNEILTSNDKIAKKLDTIISELPAINHKQREHHDRIETLETKTRTIQARLGI